MKFRIGEYVRTHHHSRNGEVGKILLIKEQVDGLLYKVKWPTLLPDEQTRGDYKWYHETWLEKLGPLEQLVYESEID